MDLNIPRFERIEEVAPLPAEIAAIVADVAAADGSANTVATLPADCATHRLFTPLDGAFNGPMAAAMTRWKGP